MEPNTWKSRLAEEYKQLKERYNKLKAYNNKQTVLKQTVLRHTQPTTMKVEEEYRDMLIKDQQHVMGEYLHILELRMTNEGIEYED